MLDLPQFLRGTTIRARAATSSRGVDVLRSCRQLGDPLFDVVFHTTPRHGVAAPAFSASHTAAQASGVGKYCSAS